MQNGVRYADAHTRASTEGSCAAVRIALQPSSQHQQHCTRRITGHAFSDPVGKPRQAFLSCGASAQLYIAVAPRSQTVGLLVN